MFIPFRHEVVTNGLQCQSDTPLYVVNLETLGVPLAGSIFRTTEGQVEIDNLRHPWESLSTGYTPMAFKIFHQGMGKRLMPGVELKASPAKLLQGHNVFGPTSIRAGAEVMWKWLGASYPELCDKLDPLNAQVYAIDCTYSSRLPNERTALQVIQALTNVTNGHTKSRGDNYQTSAYWGSKDSRLKKLKAYLKHTEFEKQLDELRKSGAGLKDLSATRSFYVMNDPKLREWVKYLLRMEATVMHRWLERRGIPTKLWDLCDYQEQLAEEGRCLIQECWQAVTKDLFAAFKGNHMKIVDDEKVLAALVAKHARTSKSGKLSDSYARNLFRTFRSIKEFGWEETYASMSRPSFYRHISDICAAGISKAVLQKLQETDRTNNIVPLLRFVEVDFSAQRPDWYVEPTVEAA